MLPQQQFPQAPPFREKAYNIFESVVGKVNFTPSFTLQRVADLKKVEPVKIREKEHYEKYFEEISGSEDKAKPFLYVFKELQNKEKTHDEMDELLNHMLYLVSHCELTPEQKSKNIIARLVESPQKLLSL
jgi:hypothetical protein